MEMNICEAIGMYVLHEKKNSHADWKGINAIDRSEICCSRMM